MVATIGPVTVWKTYFNVFGRRLLVTRQDDAWSAFYLGNEGKRRPATDIVIPRDVPDTELQQYLSDLCHEWATEQNPSVSRLD